MTDYNRIAAAVLAKCASKDPFFPKPSAALAMGWGEEFECWNLTQDQLIAGVTRAYRDNGAGFRPLPKDIVDAARTVRREQDAKTGPTADYEALCESKAADRDELAEARRLREQSPAVERPELRALVAGIAASKAVES